MLLSYDKQLKFFTDGQIGAKFEQQTLSTASNIWGGTLLSEDFLLDEQQAQDVCFCFTQHYWGQISIEASYIHEAATIALINEKLQHFFTHISNKNKLFSFIHKYETIDFQHFITFIVGQPIQLQPITRALTKLIVYKIGSRFFVQPLYSEHATYWQYVAAKKIYSLFLQQPLRSIERPLPFMRLWQTLLQSHYTKNRITTMIHKLIQQIATLNIKSYQLKQLHLFNICCHFTSGRRHFKKLRKAIAKLQYEWTTGDFALNEKEQTLLSYMLFHEAAARKDYHAVITHGHHLIFEDRLLNYAIELLIDYGDILKTAPPQPHALVKSYRANYLESIFFMLIQALVKEQRWQEAFQLLKDHELATCSALFELLNTKEPLLHTIEVVVQRDIVFHTGGTTKGVRLALSNWQQHYLQKGSIYYEIAYETSEHICNILKVLFYAEQDEMVERLLAVYKKYLLVPAHFEQLRRFMEQRATMA